MRHPIGELKDIRNIGFEKPLGYAQTPIIPKYILNKYKNDDYIIMGYTGKTHWTLPSTDEIGSYNIYIAYLPTMIEFLTINPDICGLLDIQIPVVKNDVINFVKYIIVNLVKPGQLLNFIHAVFSDYVKEDIVVPDKWSPITAEHR